MPTTCCSSRPSTGPGGHGIVNPGSRSPLSRTGGDMSITQLVTSGPLLLALPVAAAAGAVTFLSPCCLPLVPGYLSFVTGMAGAGGPASPAAPASVPAASASAAGASAAGASAAGASVAGAPVSGAPVSATAAVPPRGRVVAGTALFVLGFSVVL